MVYSCAMKILHITLCLLVLFFIKQKTAYEMRISDWSSVVCSSDLVVSGFMHQFRDIHTAFEEGDLFGGGNYSRVLKRSKEPALFQLVRGTEVRSRDQLTSRSSESLSDQARAKLLTARSALSCKDSTPHRKSGG